MKYEEFRKKRAEAYKQMRKDEKWTLKAISERYGISEPTLSRFENNKSTNEEVRLVYKQLFGEVD